MDFILFINNAALLIVMGLLSINIQTRWLKHGLLKSIVLGCLYGLSAVLAMHNPMELQPGVIFDGRSVIISLAGLFTDNITTTIACLIAAAARVDIGGQGVFTGVGSVVISGLWGIIFRRIIEDRHLQLDLKKLFVFGLINHVILVGWFFTFPLKIALLIIRVVALPYVTVFPLTTTLIGGFMQGEQQRLIVEKNLAVSERLYRDLINTFNEGVWYLDQDANTVFINPKMAEMLACEEEQVIGKPVFEFISKSDRAAFKRTVENHQRDSRGQYELKLKCCDGKSLYTQVSFTHIFDDKGEYSGLLAGVQDITALKKSQARLKEQSRRLEEIVEERTRDLKDAQEQLIKAEKLASMGELAGNVGHELRNPLAVISNSIYLLKTLLPDAGQQVEDYLQMIDKETQNASIIINDLLDYSRIQSNPKEEINLAEMVAELLSKQVFPANIKVENKIANDIPLVRANGQQLEQMLVNIINNAVEAMPAGGSLRVSSRKNKGKLTVSITDTGVGIAKKDIQRMFKPLFTTKPRGIGLGLSITSKLAELNDIKIRVRSTQGKGTIFYLDFLLMA